jgi:hypothetical protein
LKPRPVGLFQINPQGLHLKPKAVLEQPSSRGVQSQSLGRRNIALWQSHELDNDRGNAMIVA